MENWSGGSEAQRLTRGERERKGWADQGPGDRPGQGDNLLLGDLLCGVRGEAGGGGHGGMSGAGHHPL